MSASLGGIKAGRAFVLIEAVDRTGKVLEGVRHRIGRFAAQMSQMGQMIALRAAAALTPVAFSVNTYREFDDAMRRVEARSTGTGKELGALRDQAKELGRTTAFTSTHIANLQARLAQFGMNRKDIEAAVKPIMLLARSGGLGLDLGTDIMQATDAVTQVLAAFQLPTTETAGVADLLTVAVNRSKFGLEELSTALQHAAPTAANFNMSIKETIAILSAVRELGYDASIVGTAFRNMWLRLSREKGREDFNKVLQETTGRTIEFTDAAGNLKNPIFILQQLRGALQGVGNAQAADMIAKLFELRATGPSLGLMKATDTLARMLTVLGNVGGEAQRVHDKMESGIGGAFRNFEGAVEGVQIAIGEALDKMVTQMSGFSISYLQNVSNWIAANAGYIAIAVAAIGIIGAFGLALIVLGQIVMATTAIFGVMSAVTGTLFAVVGAMVSLSPAGLVAIAAAVTALAAAWVLIEQINWGKIVSGMSTSFGAIANSLKHGSIKLAWDILVLQMQLTFTKFTLEIIKQLENIAHWMLMASKFNPATAPIAWGAELGANKHGLKLVDFIDQPRKAMEVAVNLLEAKLKDKIENSMVGTLTLEDQMRGADAPAPDTSAWKAILDAMAAALDPISKLPKGGSIAPDIVEGLRIGSMEAAKAMQEAMFDAEIKDDAKRTADATEEMSDELVDMNSKLDNLVIGVV